MVLLFTAVGSAQDWTLCAKASPLRLNQGESLTFGRHSSPVFWGFNRDVVYQLCTPEGRPVSRRVRMDMIIESLDGDPGREIREVMTDGRGRFSATYGAGGLQPGAAWPEGTVSREAALLRLGGKDCGRLPARTHFEKFALPGRIRNREICGICVRVRPFESPAAPCLPVTPPAGHRRRGRLLASTPEFHRRCSP